MSDADAQEFEGLTAPEVPESSHRRSSPWAHAACVGWVVVAALAVLAPVLAHGSSFGSYDVLSRYGLLQQPGVVIHNVQGGDQSDQIIPWSMLAWTQVHHGQLPLWNPYEALGMPLAFNWQAAAFSLPTLVSYLFPLRLSFTVQVVLTLVIAGTGVYVLGRVLRLATVACVLAATVFELSGPMLGWLGWPHAAVLSWSGWLFASALLIVRGSHRLGSVTLLALVIAAMVYAGQAEILTLCGLALLVFLVALLVQRAPFGPGSGPIRRPTFDLSVGVVTGLALGAPLLLPGLQVAAGSQRAVPGGDPAEILRGNPPLPAQNLVHFVFQGFDGLPIAGSHWFGYIGGYSETAAYVGVIALVMAVTGLAVRRRRPEVIAIGAVIVVMTAVAFAPPVVAVLYRLPLVGTVLWQRAILPVAFGVAVLAGVGMDALLRAKDQRAVRRWLGGGFGVSALLLVGLWLFTRGHLGSGDTGIRARSFIWPAATSVVGLMVVGFLAVLDRRRRNGDRGRPTGVGRCAALTLLACETAFLLSAGIPLWTSTSTPFATTPAIQALKSSVGSSVVGLGGSLCFLPPGLGLPENAQIAYGVQELALYDPMIPSSYYSSWGAVSHQSAGIPDDSVYCPGIDTAQLARLYGVSYVLERSGSPGPEGSDFVRTVGDEDLYRVPASGAATLTPLTADGGLPAESEPGSPVSVAHDDPASWKIVTDTDEAQVLRLRLTNVPGWHATIDGQPVPLVPFAGVMLQMKVPAGHHTVALYYWPATFTAGLVLAGCAALGLVAAFSVALVRRRRKRVPRQSS